MKCPLKFRLYRFEGGDECDPECAWRMGVVIDGDEEKVANVCAVAASAQKDQPVVAIANWEVLNGAQ
ncbi:MAG: hypothetical protein IKG18_00865 [Atopobiaceae bacterium]|nr:hypothetical protein [Atopobiaceae bacterium]MBR3312667.1 hypothetical protein [Atopobiaceae bacterium]